MYKVGQASQTATPQHTNVRLLGPSWRLLAACTQYGHHRQGAAQQQVVVISLFTVRLVYALPAQMSERLSQGRTQQPVE